MGSLLALVAAPIICVSLTAESGPVSQAFSGTWVLDPERSVLYGGVKRELELVVVDVNEKLTVTERRRGGTDEYSVPFDGKPHEQTRAGGRFSRTLRRQNGVLLFHITMNRLADQASIQYSERWSLSDGGRTLTIYTAYPGGRDVLKVFARKD